MFEVGQWDVIDPAPLCCSSKSERYPAKSMSASEKKIKGEQGKKHKKDIKESGSRHNKV